MVSRGIADFLVSSWGKLPGALFLVAPSPIGSCQLVPGHSLGPLQCAVSSWFVIGDVLAFLGERKDRVLRQATIVPVITPLLYGMSVAIAPLMAVALWLSVFDCIVPRGQAIFVLGLIVLLMYAAVEFLFFIGLMSQQGRHVQSQGEARNFD
jgi:hypothetical protein